MRPSLGPREGVVRAFAVKRMDEESRWDAKYLQEMKGTPQQPDPSRPGLAIPIKVNIDPPHEESPAPAEGPVDECDRQIRRITGVMLQKYGYTEGCDGCRYKRAGMREAPSHAEVCRRRMGEAMMEDETDRRKEEDDERVNWRLAEKMEKILEEKQETAETIEKEPEDVGPWISRRRGPRGSACRSASTWAQWGQRRSAGREKRGPQETKEVQGENKRPRKSAPEGESAELPMDLSLIQQLQRVSVDVAELYSPPRVTAEAQKFGLKTGEAMDILTGWDFTKDEHKRMAKEYIDKDRLIVGSPMCAMFSALQNLTPWTEEKQHRWREDRKHLQLVGELYKQQVKEGRWFLRTHPASATSWSLKEITDVMDMDGVDVTAADQCMFGLKTWCMDRKSWEPAMKKTRFMSNSANATNNIVISKYWGRAPDLRLGTRSLCRAICMGLMKGLRNKEECHVKKMLELTEHTTIGEIPEEETVDFDVEAWDDVTGKALDPKAVRQARLKEMKYVKETEVWQPISWDEARRRGWKVVKTRWIDINKGDEDTPNYWSRLVAKQFKDGAGEGLFASTPLEALRFLISEAATVRGGRGLGGQGDDGEVRGLRVLRGTDAEGHLCRAAGGSRRGRGHGRTLDHEPIRHARRRRELPGRGSGLS